MMDKAAAVIFNEMPGCDEPGGTVTAREVVRDVMRDFPGPVVMGLASGHTAGPSLTLPFGVETTVSVETSPRIVIEEAAVS